MSNLSRLGKYTIQREIGKGAMGVVYQGFDPVIERTVAIKTILPQQLNVADTGDVLARFKREAQAAGRLNHPGIVAVYDYGEALVEDDQTVLAADNVEAAAGQKVAFIAMEFVKGRELRDFFETNKRFSLPEVGRLMGEILAALSHAHANGVVHRDMKPANLIVLDDGHVKIADFGIARVEKSELTQTGTVMGTPAYMSPEQFLGQPVDGRSDLFSCGVILYQFLTGEKPFTGTTTTIMYKVLREEPLAPSILNLTLPPALDGVVKKAIAKNPEQRFQSAAEFAKAIQTALTGPTPQATLVPTATPVKARSNKTAGALAGLTLAIAVASGAYLYTNRTPSRPDAPTTAAQSPAPVTAPASDPPQEAGNVIISALGLVDPKDPRFQGDPAAAQDGARADAKRQLVEKALVLYIDNDSLDKNYSLLEQKLMSRSAAFIKTVLQEGTPTAGKDGLLGAETRAVVKMRDVQKSLNQLSKDERINFIRNNGDPTVSIRMTVANADAAQAWPATRSQLAENVLKERIKSFGLRVWSNDGEVSAGPDTKAADFLIQGEARVKQLSAKLPASGLTITKTALTSWTVKAIDKASGEEIYLNTVIPKAQSWPTEDQALTDIGKLMGDEFSRNFFLQYFNFGVRPTLLKIRGLPDAQTAHLLLRELRGARRVLDAQPGPEAGSFRLQLAQGDATSLLQDAVIKPLNRKLGQNCLTFTGSNEGEISIDFASACSAPAVSGKFQTLPPAGLLDAPAARGRPFFRVGIQSNAFTESGFMNTFYFEVLHTPNRKDSNARTGAKSS